jgi:RNA polymerase sigma-70 factor (ECF subfamily)
MNQVKENSARVEKSSPAKANEIVTDKRLVEKILTGDSTAFTELVEKYQKLVSHLVFRMLPRSADHEDVCQDIFIKIYRNLGYFQFHSRLSTWIAKITFNTCVNYLNKKKTGLYADFTDADLDALPANLAGPAADAEQKDTASHLKLLIEQLPVHYRTILTLFHLEEMSYQEICEVTEMPEGTVKNYLFRARKLLKESLLANYPEEVL